MLRAPELLLLLAATASPSPAPSAPPVPTASPAAAPPAPAAAPTTPAVFKIEDLVQRIADSRGATYILSKEAQGRTVEFVTPRTLDKLKASQLDALFQAALTATGLIVKDGERSTRIEAAKDGKGRDLIRHGAGDKPFMVAMADVDQVGLNRLDRVQRAIEERGAKVILDHRANLLLAVHQADRVDVILRDMRELNVTPIVMQVSARSPTRLMRAMEAVLSYNARTAVRTWSRGTGGSIIGGSPAAPPPKAAPAPATKH